jgi:ketosteroid isomerase-like protein
VPSDNTELFHRIAREWRERRRIPAELLADDVEWVNPDDAVETGSRRGPEAFNEAIAQIYEGWEESRFEAERVIASGDEVVALGELHVRGREVGVDIRREHGQIWTFRDGRATRMRWFNSREEALAAAGLSSAP